MIKLTKPMRRWLARANDTKTPWSENDLIYFRKYLNNAAPEIRQLLLNKFKTYNITVSHEQKGTNYLLNKSLKLNGQKRKQCKLNDAEINILKQCETHQLIGLHNMSNNYCPVFVPIFRAVSTNGDYFDYTGVTYRLMEVFR